MFLGLLIFCGSPAWGEPVQVSDVPAGEAPARQPIEEIVVTGTRLKRRDTFAPSPIFTVNRDALANAAQPTLEETLNQLPLVTPDFGRTSNNPGNGTARINLRGMGSQRTLVLLNGRRFAPSGVGSSVDLNNVPQILIDRVEIITGGASAVYGSDALAGVVNFITKDDLQGLMFDTSYGLTDESDAEFLDVSVAFGTEFAAGKGRLTLFANYYDRDSLLAGGRALTNNTLVENGGGGLTQSGSFSTPESAIFNFVPGLGFPTFNPDGTPRSFINPDDQFNTAPLNYLQTPLERASAGVLGSFKVSDTTEIYSEATFSRNDSAIELAPVPALEFVSVNLDNPLLTPAALQLFTDSFSNPAGPNPNLASFTVGRRLSELGSRITNYERDYWRVLFGAKTELGARWSLEGWVSYTRAEETDFLRNDGSASRLLQGLLVDPLTNQCFDPSGGCVPIDIFGPDRISPEAVRFVGYQPLENQTERSQKLLSLYVSGSPANTWAGPLDLVVGLDWRSDTVDFEADPALFTDDTLGYRGEAPVNGTERIGEIYAELLIPLLYAKPAADSLDVELGARLSDYENAGEVWTYKAGSSWQINPMVRVRSMWQRSVRAPNNLELFQRQFSEQSNFVGNFLAIDNCSASQDPVANGFADACVAQGLPANLLGTFEAVPFFPVEFVRGGNRDLEPETARTFTAGVVVTPESVGNWQISLDYYEIDIKDSIGDIDAKAICFDTANDNNLFCDRIERISDPASASVGNVFRVEELVNNRGRISTDGLDLQVRFSYPLADAWAFAGASPTFSGNLIWTHTQNLEFQGSRLGTSDSCVGYFSVPCTGFDASSTAVKNRIAANFVYKTDVASVGLSARWIDGTSSYRFVEATRNGTPRPDLAVSDLGSRLYVDLNTQIEIGAGATLGLGVTNLFNKQAPVIPNQNYNTDAQLYDVFGRSFRLTVRWTNN
ncbi:MAG: TonB-dependent receptor [Pseudomonadota bacterium]